MKECSRMRSHGHVVLASRSGSTQNYGKTAFLKGTTLAIAIVKSHIANWLALAEICGKHFGDRQLVPVQSPFLFFKNKAKKPSFCPETTQNYRKRTPCMEQSLSKAHGRDQPWNTEQGCGEHETPLPEGTRSGTMAGHCTPPPLV